MSVISLASYSSQLGSRNSTFNFLKAMLNMIILIDKLTGCRIILEIACVCEGLCRLSYCRSSPALTLSSEMCWAPAMHEKESVN